MSLKSRIFSCLKNGNALQRYTTKTQLNLYGVWIQTFTDLQYEGNNISWKRNVSVEEQTINCTSKVRLPHEQQNKMGHIASPRLQHDCVDRS